ncbi:methyltransferase domain-containing protein [Prosthecomicrobium sp. N25]|uniref:methyltransferase domain-containing protein n=1 Tax=Prosthecomicrobium sp. N25 TaxID=3129254 RepID=UPI003076E4ED
MSHPVVFDRALLAARRRRALDRASPGADFLMARVAEDLEDRLATVARRFERAAVMGDPTGLVAAALRRTGKADRIVRAVPPGAVPGSGDLVADEEALPFAPAALDLVVAGLSLHWVNDLPGSLVQIRRALAPDGLFLAALLGGDTLAELREVLLAAEVEVAGGASPRVAPFLDVRDMGSLLQRAGFALPVTDVDRVTVRYDGLFALLADLRAMGATSVLEERSRRPATRRLFFRAAEIYAERFADPDGRIRATFEVLSASGWAPHESQQKPARPGSATVRLADALGTTERPTGDKAAR